MNRLITSTAIPARAVKIEALTNMTASFESFCLGCRRHQQCRSRSHCEYAAPIGSRALLAPLRRTSSLDLGVLRHLRPFDPSSRTWAQELFHVPVAEVDDAARRLS